MFYAFMPNYCGYVISANVVTDVPFLALHDSDLTSPTLSAYHETTVVLFLNNSTDTTISSDIRQQSNAPASVETVSRPSIRRLQTFILTVNRMPSALILAFNSPSGKSPIRGFRGTDV